MIRINLIGRGPGQKGKKGGAGLRLPDIPNVGILLFVLMLVIEGAVFYLWQMSASDQATRANARLQLRKRELTELEKNKASIAAATEEIKKLAAQKSVFDELFAEKVGPIGALQFLSFIVQPRDEATTATEDLKALEAAGWRVAWDARKAWITSYRDQAGEVTILGRALGHEDVAEVQRRLESSPYFRDPRLVYQENKRDDRLGIGFVEFSIRATLVYLIEPQKKDEPAKAEGVGAAGAPGADAGGGDGGADADAGTTTDKDGALIVPKLQIDVPSQASATADDATTTADAEPADAKSAPDAATDDAADSAPPPDTAKAEPKKEDKPPPPKAEPSKYELPKEDPKMPVPSAGQALEPPPAVGADKPPAANEP